MLVERRGGFMDRLRERREYRRSPEGKAMRAVREISAKLAFVEEWTAANSRMDEVVSKVPHTVREAGIQSQFDLAFCILDQVEKTHDPQYETILQTTAALIARRNKLFTQIGLSDPRAIHAMLRRAHNLTVEELEPAARDDFEKALSGELPGYLPNFERSRRLVRDGKLIQKCFDEHFPLSLSRLGHVRGH